MAAKKGLGKGLDSLITDKVSKPVKPKSNHAADAVMIDINKVEPNREQPRKKFDEDALIELSESIKQFGIYSLYFARKGMITMKSSQVSEDGEQQSWQV